MDFDKDRVHETLRRAWSWASSSKWSPEKTALGQCSPTALVIQDILGGSLLKTRASESWHFYNCLDGRPHDFTADQFMVLPTYEDVPTTRSEVLCDCTHDQYSALALAFRVEWAIAQCPVPPPSIVYRRLLPNDDLEAITHLLHRAYAALAAAGMRFVASHQDVDTTRQRIDQGEAFVAELDGLIVGTITLRAPHAAHGSPFYDRPDVTKFLQFAVWPSLQRWGIGSRLLELVECRARELGVAELALDTSEQATALIAMYTKKGYRFVEYVRWDDVNYRSVVLSKSLT